MGRRRVYNSITILALMCVQSLSGRETTWTPELMSLYQRSVSRAIDFLRRSQNEDGSFSSELGARRYRVGCHIVAEARDSPPGSRGSRRTSVS